MNIKELRSKMGMTQKEFGEYLGISPRTLQNWEINRTSPPDYVLELIKNKVKGDENMGKITIGVGYEEYLELEGKLLEKGEVHTRQEEKRDHIKDGLHNVYFIDVDNHTEKWLVNNIELDIDIIVEHDKGHKRVTRMADKISDMIVYEDKSLEEVAELFNASIIK